jgi:uncharacterized protein DUF2336/PilZ domain-containing protein
MPPPEEMGEAALQQLIELLEGRLESAGAAERARILTEVTGLFLRYAGWVSGPTIALFDQIFLRLIDGLPAPALVPLSETLAALDHPPVQTIVALARHGAAEVAAPVLSLSKALSLSDLAAAASAGSPEHLLAIAGRPRIDQRLSSIVIGRAMPLAIDRLLANPNAHFTRDDFCAALPRASADNRGRVPLRQPALILDTSGRPAGRCVTLDISPGGLKLQIGPGAPLVETFTIELSAIERTRLRGRIAWRQLAIVGMQFTTPLAEQLLPKPDRN